MEQNINIFANSGPLIKALWIVYRLMSVLMKWDGTMGEEQAGDAKTACDEPNSPEASSAYLGGYTIHTAHLPKLHLSLFRAETLGEANPGQVQRG